MLGPGRQERSWIRGAQGGSASDLEALFREHWPRAHRAAYLVVQDGAAAEDIAQEAFLSAMRNLDRFDRRRPFGPWLHRIVVNRAIDWARARALRREARGPGAEDFDTGDLGTFSERRRRGLASLKPEHRAVIVLRYLLEYSPGEIAELLDLPRGTVNSRMRRGLDRLETILDRETMSDDLAPGAPADPGARRARRVRRAWARRPRAYETHEPSAGRRRNFRPLLAAAARGRHPAAAPSRRRAARSWRVHDAITGSKAK